VASTSRLFVDIAILSARLALSTFWPGRNFSPILPIRLRPC